MDTQAKLLKALREAKDLRSLMTDVVDRREEPAKRNTDDPYWYFELNS